jgi:hypothetical protein
VCRTGEARNAYRILVMKYFGKLPFEMREGAERIILSRD